MQFSISTQTLKQTKVDCLVMPITNKQTIANLNKSLGAPALTAIEKGRAIGDLTKFKQNLLVPQPEGLAAKRLLVISCGENHKISFEDFITLLQQIYATLTKAQCSSACLALDKLCVAGHDQAWTLKKAMQLLHAFTYRFEAYKTKKTPVIFNALSFHCNKAQGTVWKKALQQANALNTGLTLTKDLGNTPPNIAIPTYLSQQAKQLCKASTKLSCKIHGEKDLKRLKMGALLAVGAGSQHESQLIEVHYNGSKRKQDPIVLVGKGVTFDTGGTSLKPGPGMEEMKYDMCGAATVLGTIAAIAELNLPINVIGIVPSVENMPDGVAYKPGDVLTSMSGQTIEVLNTDAEGRLILCDALTYAQTFKPSLLMDMATLTGAMVVSLGTDLSGFFSTDQTIAKQLTTAAKNSTDDAWQMPLRKAYVKKTDSKVADMRNIGPRWGGACIAAGFLSRFVDDKQKWVHLDIAGTAYQMGNSVGGTGRPVPLLVEFLQKLKL